MKRTGSAVWNGELKTGSGTVSTDSGVLDKVAYSFGKRFGDDAGSNPEELIAAAHAGCYSMALSNVLGGEGMTPEKIETSATVTLEMLDAGPTITAVHLVVNAKVPGADADAFQKAAEGAKTGCPVSKVLNAEITMDATLES
ncbi:OsmC family protein [Amaricoccus tamworthensis]|uniref:OsmC family protein n=1 Tax=Amaricoccus tamworthensis TaxID=57002 RepID=UPI003C7AAE51